MEKLRNIIIMGILNTKEYNQGKKWFGKGYNIRGKKYEIKEGKGKIEEYNQEGKKIFEGEYLNGE